MSLFTGLTIPHKLGGVFGLSCYLVLGDKIKEFAKEASEANKDTPFFMAHGDADQVVKFAWGQQTAEVLQKELGHKVDFKVYRYVKNGLGLFVPFNRRLTRWVRGLGHSADMDEIDDLEKFIKACLPASEAL